MVKVLFVCVGNACRSQIAEAYAHRHGADVLEPYSTGTRPSAELNPRAAAVLARRGLSIDGAHPKSVDEVPPGPYEWMIRMGCGDVLLVPALHREDWDLPPPSSLSDADFEALCDDIVARVRALVARARTWAEATRFPLCSDLGDDITAPPPAVANPLVLDLARPALSDGDGAAWLDTPPPSVQSA